MFLHLQIREPFNVMSVVKSPMGLMMGFMLVVMFLMPKLMENMGKVLWPYYLCFTSGLKALTCCRLTLICLSHVILINPYVW